MSTREPELTEPVDLCTPDGTRLNPAARGWSRYPLHRCNLVGQRGRNKRWDYWAVLAGDVVVSALYSNIDHFGVADAWWADLSTGESGGSSTLGAADAMDLPERPGTAPLQFTGDALTLAITDDGRETRLVARWTERDGRPGEFDIAVALPDGHESLNVVIPWSDEQFNFTSKHQARPANGRVVVGEREWVIGADDNAWGVLDVGRGRWPSQIDWNWGGGGGRAGDHVVGLQFGAKWTAGTGFTENGIIVDGRLSKLGNELAWEYDWDEPMAPWRVTDPDGQLDVTLVPRFDKHTKVGDETGFGSETHQMFGEWTGRVVTDGGLELRVSDLSGFAEEARQRW